MCVHVVAISTQVSELRVWGQRVSQRVRVSACEGGLAMGKQVDYSGTRQKTIMMDRRHTRAISFYVQEHRAELLTRVTKSEKSNKDVKRKALEREGRLAFRALPDSEQAKFLRMAEVGTSRVAAHEPGVVHAQESGHQGVRAQDSEESGRQDVRVQESEESGRQDVRVQRQMSPPPRVHRQALSRSPPRVERPSAAEQPQASQGTKSHLCIESQWPCTGQNPVRDGLLRAVPHVRVLYGDAGAAEVLAQGLRILSVMGSSLVSWPVFANVKTAIIVGVSVKMTQTERAGGVLNLWTNIAGAASLPQVRKWEPRLVNGLASKSLGSEYFV